MSSTIVISHFRIHSWFIRWTGGLHDLAEYNRTPTLIYFHGNAGNISHRLKNASDLYRVLKCNILLVEYRGYGISDGVSSELGLKYDAEAALNYILNRKDLNPNQIFVFGRSLGGAVAIHLAASHQDQINALIVENTFTCVDDMISLVIPSLYYFKFLSKSKWNSFEEITKISKLPVLFLSGQADELVPPKQMKTLYDRCPSKKKALKFFPTGTHNETWTQDDYYDCLQNYVEKYSK